MEQKIRDVQQKLSDLRQDRTRFFTVPNVLDIYKEFKHAVDGISAEEQEQLHTIISDCILIFSLAFNTVGFTRQPIAVYAKAVTLMTVFKFIRWDPAFTPKELGVLKESIRDVSNSLTLEDDGDIPVVDYVNAEIEKINSELADNVKHATDVMNTLPEDEYPVYSQVTHLRRYILAEVISNDFNSERRDVLKNKLFKAQAHVNIHRTDEGAAAGEPAHHCSDLLEYQLRKASILIELFKNGVSESEMEKEDKELLPLYDTLKKMLPVLEVFVMTRRWTLRVTDLYQHMKTLLRCVPAVFPIDTSTSYELNTVIPRLVDKSHKYRYLIVYLSRRAWALIFKLLDTTEPVSEALYSLYNQLLTMKRCLGEVRLAGGISNLRELYPYQLKLASLDNVRKDGKFVVGNEVPPGQGVLNGMLAECFDMVYELKIELEEKGEDGDDSNAVEDENGISSGDESEHSGSDDCDDDDDACSSVLTPSKASSIQPDDATDHLADVPEATE